MLQYVKEMFGWLLPIDDQTPFEKASDNLLEVLRTTMPENTDCVKVSKMINILQEWSIKNCPMLKEPLL